MIPRSTDQLAGSSGDRSPTRPAAPMGPGDEAPPSSPATGETVCPDCGGTGRIDSQTCGNCGGTGQVTVGIGGA
jgi:RecJ-like exonuclease